MSASVPQANPPASVPREVMVQGCIGARGYCEAAIDAVHRCTGNLPMEPGDIPFQVEYALDQIARAIHQLKTAYQKLHLVRDQQNAHVAELAAIEEEATVQIGLSRIVNGHEGGEA